MASKDVIAIDGMAAKKSFILSFTRDGWIKEKETGPAHRDKPDAIRRAIFGQMWDLAGGVQEKPKPTKKKK